MAPDDFLDIPGIFEIVSEHFNNEVLSNLQRHREEAEDNDKEEEDLVLHAGGLCPVCGCNPLRDCGDVLVCTGDVCGFRKEK